MFTTSNVPWFTKISLNKKLRPIYIKLKDSAVKNED